MGKRIVAVVGSYRKDGTIDQTVEAIMAGARERGASTSTIYLRDQHVEFCTNCRTCTQTAGPERGKCIQQDDLEPMLAEIEAADAIVLASPVNYYNVTAIFRRFMERTLGTTWWPWNRPMPKPRSHIHHQKAILVASAAMPAPMIPLFTGSCKALKITAQVFGAKPVGKLWIGLAGGDPHPKVSPKVLVKARKLGLKLA